MPYIKQESREAIDLAVGEVIKNVRSSGDAAYVITTFLQDFMDCDIRNYTHYATVIGILETVKMEFYRREIAAYEDEKCEQNGDVF
jgi:hypothetical protein